MGKHDKAYFNAIWVQARKDMKEDGTPSMMLLPYGDYGATKPRIRKLPTVIQEAIDEADNA